MFNIHKDKQRYFNIQKKVTTDYILPFIEGACGRLTAPKQVMEIGCAEAGVLSVFYEAGHHCTGVELSEGRVKLAEGFVKDLESKGGSIQFSSKDIYDVNPDDLSEKLDLIILKDVIEHIPNQERFMAHLSKFLKPGGCVFFAFPPWYMPFGGHQQIARSKILSKIPFIHLLPRPLYKAVQNAFGEPKVVVDELLFIQETGISIERFERICKKNALTIKKRKVYFTNPIYKYKFSFGAMQQLPIVRNIPYMRDFVSTCVYYVVEKP